MTGRVTRRMAVVLAACSVLMLHAVGSDEAAASRDTAVTPDWFAAATQSPPDHAFLRRLYFDHAYDPQIVRDSAAVIADLRSDRFPRPVALYLATSLARHYQDAKLSNGDVLLVYGVVYNNLKQHSPFQANGCLMRYLVSVPKDIELDSLYAAMIAAGWEVDSQTVGNCQQSLHTTVVQDPYPFHAPTLK